MFNLFNKKQPPRDWIQLTDKAIELYKNNEFSQAIDLLKQSIAAIEASDKGDPEALAWAYFYWGKAAIKLKDIQQGWDQLQLAQQAVERREDPSYANVQGSILLAQADLLSTSGHPEKGLGKYEQALTKLPQKQSQERLNIYRRIGQLSEYLRDYEKAIDSYRGYLALWESLKGKDPHYHQIARVKSMMQAAFQAKQKGFPSPWVNVQHEDGSEMKINSTYAQHLVSDLPNPTQESLNEMLQGIIGAYLMKMEYEEEERADGSKTLKGSFNFIRREENPESINFLKSQFVLAPKVHMGYALETSNAYMRLIKNTGECIDINFISSNTIRIANKWKYDAEVVDGEIFKQAFESCGISLA